jgi:hypothetical protein
MLDESLRNVEWSAGPCTGPGERAPIAAAYLVGNVGHDRDP